jgi:hypothetical protein
MQRRRGMAKPTISPPGKPQVSLRATRYDTRHRSRGGFRPGSAFCSALIEIEGAGKTECPLHP